LEGAWGLDKISHSGAVTESNGIRVRN